MTEQLTQGISRRRVLVASAWTAPAVVLAVGAPASAASTVAPSGPPPAGVVTVRAGGPAWTSYTEQNLMPGFRFSATQAVTATLVIAKSGTSTTAATVLFPYDAMVFNGNNNVFTASAVQLDPSKTKGVTIKNTPAAIGSYTATIYFPAGSSTAIATAAFTIYQGGDGKLAVSVP